MEASKQLKITKIRKTHYQNAPTIKTCKKMTVTQFWLFFQRSRTPEIHWKWELKLSLQAPKITKNRKSKHSKTHQKITLQKVKNLFKFVSKWDEFFAQGAPQKSQQSQKSSQWTPGSLKRAAGPQKSLKITILTSQSLQNPLRTACFLHSCFQYFLTEGVEKNWKT